LKHEDGLGEIEVIPPDQVERLGGFQRLDDDILIDADGIVRSPKDILDVMLSIGLGPQGECSEEILPHH